MEEILRDSHASTKNVKNTYHQDTKTFCMRILILSNNVNNMMRRFKSSVYIPLNGKKRYFFRFFTMIHSPPEQRVRLLFAPVFMDAISTRLWGILFYCLRSAISKSGIVNRDNGLAEMHHLSTPQICSIGYVRKAWWLFHMLQPFHFLYMFSTIQAIWSLVLSCRELPILQRKVWHEVREGD